MFYLALVIPCYNEEMRIRPTLNVYLKYFQENSFFREKKVAIILVNDGSQDKTEEIITNFTDLSTNNITIKAVNYHENKGKGYAIKHGCEKVNAEFYGFVDADLSFKPELTEQAIKILNNFDCDLLIGQRNNDYNNSIYTKIRAFISKTLRRIVNFFLSIPNIDTQCGFKFFKKEIVNNILPQIKQNRFSFDIELILLSKQKNFKIKTLPLYFENKNDSTVTWKDGVRYIFDIISINENLKIVVFKNLVYKLILLSSIISFTVYGWVIFKGYLFSDDFTWLWHGQKISNSLFNIITFRMSTFYSPVLNAFYSLAYSVFGYNPQPLFFAGIIIHILVSVVSGIFAWQLSKSKLIAITTSCLVAFAGVAYEPVVWIGANMHSFVSLFVLLSLICFYNYLQTGKGSLLIFSFLSYILALGTKESAIITPALLFATLIYYRIDNKKQFTKTQIIFWTSTICLSIMYLYQQYLWQKNGVWVQTGVWNINFTSFFKIPLILLDNFFPISFLRDSLSTWSAGILWLLAISMFLFILFKFKKLKLIWYGFFWLIISISPFIFFKTEFWWDVLASRYNYLPRIGAILIIAAILQHLIVNNKARYIISGTIIFVMISVSAQLFFMGKVITTEYDYVYNTGRSLSQTMQKIKILDPEKVFVRWDHPFTENNAHIVGAASIIANLNESNVIFLEKNADEALTDTEILMYWNPYKREYKITQNNY